MNGFQKVLIGLGTAVVVAVPLTLGVSIVADEVAQAAGVESAPAPTPEPTKEAPAPKPEPKEEPVPEPEEKITEDLDVVFFKEITKDQDLGYVSEDEIRFAIEQGGELVSEYGVTATLEAIPYAVAGGEVTEEQGIVIGAGVITWIYVYGTDAQVDELNTWTGVGA